ncbi:MAG TPA: efflux RND transporter permease subunit, partial [Gemmataceae bacterium]
MINLASKMRPYFGAVVLTVGLLTAGGIYSAWRMPSAVYPEVTFPRIMVIANKPGLDLRTMEVQVTFPLEQAVSTVIGVSQVRSKTIRGASELSIDFTPGTDMRRAEQLTWNRIGSVRSQLPVDVELIVEQMTPSVFPILSVVLTGGDNPSQLRDYAFYKLAPKIKNIPDVLYANVTGGDLREIEVEVRPDDLLAAGLSAADLADQIGKLHQLQPVGRIEKEPFSFQLIVDTQVKSAAQIEDLIVTTKNNQPLTVKDVATVRISHQDRVSSVGYDGKDAVVLSVFRRLGGNTVNISRNIEQLLETQPRPRNIQATVVYDQSTFITTAVDNVRDAILIGGLFSVLILLGFLQGVRPLAVAIPTMIVGALLALGGWALALGILRVLGQDGWAATVREGFGIALVGGACIAFFVVGIFYWRATLISALAIPITLAITFLFLYWSGESLNLMSLGGLAVAIGLIIDDTVVVIENISRHLSPAARHVPIPPTGPSAAAQTVGATHAVLGAPQAVPLDPVDAASAEITGAVIGSTLTTVLVFVPLAFIVGVYGQFFAALSWSLSIAVLVSMVISLTLVPVFAAKFLAGKPMPQPGRIYHFFEHLYERMLTLALSVPWLTLAVSVVAVIIGAVFIYGIPNWFVKEQEDQPAPAPLVKGLETGLMPSMDEGAFILDYFAPSGTPLARTEEMVRELEKILSENPDVASYVRRTGSENGLFATQSHRGDISVILRPAENDPISLIRKRVREPFSDAEKELRGTGKEAFNKKYRRRKASEIMDEVGDEIKERFSEHQLKFETIPIIEDELNDLSGVSRPIEVKLFGPDYAKLRELAETVGDVMEKKGAGRGLTEVQNHVSLGNPDLKIEVDGVWAARGLSTDLVARQLKAMYLGQVATQVRESAVRITDVRVRFPDDLRFGPGSFDRDRLNNQLILLPESLAPPVASAPSAVPSLSGPARAVPVSTVARVTPIRTPEEEWRENQQPAIFVTADLKESEAGLGSAVKDVRKWMGQLQAKGAFPPGYRWDLGGQDIRQREAFASLGTAMIIAILLVFIMLAIQFRSVLLPLLIFLTQPLSLVCGLFALWITNTPLNVSSYMGMILLIGLDMKNGILLVEYIQQLRREGMELRPALLLAGRTRFRPILMTSLAAILGMLPLALGIGPGAQMQQPLAIMVIGGLTANMLFTRVVIPVGYLVMERRPKPTVQPAIA